MNIGVKDDVVATDNQLALWEAFGRPNCRIFTDEHFYAVIRANAFYFHDYFKFLKRNSSTVAFKRRHPTEHAFFIKSANSLKILSAF